MSVRPSGVCVSGKWLVGPSSTSNRATCFFYFTWRYRALLRSFTVQGRCIGLETRALYAAILWCRGSQRIMSQNRARWRAASSGAFALYVLSQGVGARRRLLSSVRISVHAVALCASCEPACRAKPSMRCAARTQFFFITKPRATGRFGVRYARRPRRTRGGRGARYAHTIVNAHHVS